MKRKHAQHKGQEIKLVKPDADHPLAHEVSRSERAHRRGGSDPAPRILDIGDETEVATDLRERFFSDGLVFVDGQLFEYLPEEGIWKPVDEAVLPVHAMSYSGANKGDGGRIRANSSFVAGVSKLVKLQAQRDSPNGFFRQAKRGVVFFDDVTVMGTAKELLVAKHSPHHRQRDRVESKWDPDANAPRFEKFLETSFADQPESQLIRRLLAQFVGVALFGEPTRHQKALLLYGPGGSGKSALLNIVGSLFRHDSVARVSLNDIGTRFRNTQLADARINIVPDLDATPLRSTGPLKQLIVGDTMQFERKNKDPFNAAPICANFFSCNELPAVDDKTPGFWDRWIVVPCTSVIRGTEKEVKGLDRLIITEEKAGVVAWAAKGYEDFVQNEERYSVPESCVSALNDWKLNSNPIAEFAMARIRNANGETGRCDATIEVKETPGADLQSAYAAWCKETGNTAKSPSQFSQGIRALGYSYRRVTGTSRYGLELKR